MTPIAWVSRRVLWFATAYTIVILVHEAAHAIVASGAGLDATLFNFWVNVDSTNQATVGQRAAFGVAGPLSSLVLGLIGWGTYRRAIRTRAALPLLYLAAHGVSNFFGNLMSTAFIGDFSNVAIWLGLPMAVRYIASVVGALVTATVLFRTGRELARFTPPHVSRARAVLLGVALPAVIGTALIVVVNQPNPLPGFMAARVGESAFWVFAAAGTLRTGARSREGDAPLAAHWLDGAAAIVCAVIVRMLIPGIPLNSSNGPRGRVPSVFSMMSDW